MSYARLLRTLFITLAASVALPLLGADPSGVPESRQTVRLAQASVGATDQAVVTSDAHAVQSALSTAGDAQVVRVAAAASAPGGFTGVGLMPQERPSFTADPPAFVLFVAGVLAVLFISTRRRKDR